MTLKISEFVFDMYPTDTNEGLVTGFSRRIHSFHGKKDYFKIKPNLWSRGYTEQNEYCCNDLSLLLFCYAFLHLFGKWGETFEDVKERLVQQRVIGLDKFGVEIFGIGFCQQ